MFKDCFKCGQRKPLAAFYKHKAMADGHLNKCIECTKRDVRQRRLDDPEKVRSYDRERAKLPHRVAATTRNTAEWRRRFPERWRAQQAVARAMKSGALVKLHCFCCGAEEVEAHHPDYSRPLDVIWLCAAHHKEIHLAHDRAAA